MEAGKLEVQLKGAKGIKGTEAFGLGKADPYAKLKCGRQFFRSRTAQDQGSSPVWNETFVFDIQENASEWLYIEILDEDILLQDDDLGTARIFLSRVLQDNNNVVPEKEFYVMYRGKIRGCVQLSLTFTPLRRNL